LALLVRDERRPLAGIGAGVDDLGGPLAVHELRQLEVLAGSVLIGNGDLALRPTGDGRPEPRLAAIHRRLRPPATRVLPVTKLAGSWRHPGEMEVAIRVLCQ